MGAVLEVEGLVKHYGATRAVQDVSLTVRQGDVYGLLGPNGSGKTTTLSCALGLLPHDGGRISVLGLPAAEIHRSAGRVACVFDAPTLVDALSCRQNLRYARTLLGHSGGRSDDEALALTGISALAERRAGRLSLGQRRRLSIARALIGRPELLVLDEPLSGLDTVGVRAMLQLFASLHASGLTMLISSHRLHEMETIVTRVAILSGGRKVAESSLDELLQGGRLRLRIHATPAERVLGVFERATGIAGFDRLPGDEYAVRPGTVAPAELNRALHAAGCAVAAFVPERVTLQSAFEELVDPAQAAP